MDLTTQLHIIFCQIDGKAAYRCYVSDGGENLQDVTDDYEISAAEVEDGRKGLVIIKKEEKLGYEVKVT